MSEEKNSSIKIKSHSFLILGFFGKLIENCVLELYFFWDVYKKKFKNNKKFGVLKRQLHPVYLLGPRGISLLPVAKKKKIARETRF